MTSGYTTRSRRVFFAAAALLLVCSAVGVMPPHEARAVKSGPDASPRQEPTRRALLIGNANYKDPRAKLTGIPINDARQLGQALEGERLGYKAVVKLDLKTKAEMEAAVQEFGSTLDENSIGLFFYAGHGVQVDGNNYLIPVDATFATADDVKRDALDLDSIYRVMRAARARLSIVILDACRENPYPKRPPAESSTPESCALGLAPPSPRAPGESIIAYATDPNGVAANESIDGNSRYTSGLLKYIRRPGLRIEEVFKLVNTHVGALSFQRQRPWMTSSLSDRNKETYFSQPVYMLGKIGNGDDEVIVVVNDEQKMVWTINGAEEIPILLNPGDNTFAIQVYNARTFSDLLRFHPEGWSYSVCFTTMKKDALQCFAAEEREPERGGRHHGKSFWVAKAIVHVHEETGAINFRSVEPDIWK